MLNLLAQCSLSNITHSSAVSMADYATVYNKIFLFKYYFTISFKCKLRRIIQKKTKQVTNRQ